MATMNSAKERIATAKVTSEMISKLQSSQKPWVEMSGIIGMGYSLLGRAYRPVDRKWTI